jgi:hypothetical protein
MPQGNVPCEWWFRDIAVYVLRGKMCENSCLWLNFDVRYSKVFAHDA